jgi:hypothetical protein
VETVASGVALRKDELTAGRLVDVNSPVQDLVKQERQDDWMIGRTAAISDLGLVGHVC